MPPGIYSTIEWGDWIEIKSATIYYNYVEKNIIYDIKIFNPNDRLI